VHVALLSCASKLGFGVSSVVPKTDEPTHALPTLPFDTTGLEPFPLITPDGTLEKSAGPFKQYFYSSITYF
jgi:hypothetical protein